MNVYIFWYAAAPNKYGAAIALTEADAREILKLASGDADFTNVAKYLIMAICSLEGGAVASTGPTAVHRQSPAPAKYCRAYADTS